jgi:alkylation response protein AidB-like acyl-CoA dehydrogenase
MRLLKKPTRDTLTTVFCYKNTLKTIVSHLARVSLLSFLTVCVFAVLGLITASLFLFGTDSQWRDLVDDL